MFNVGEKIKFLDVLNNIIKCCVIKKIKFYSDSNNFNYEYIVDCNGIEYIVYDEYIKSYMIGFKIK